MGRLFALVVMLLCSIAGVAQIINPNTQINWPQASGVGVPSSSCGAANYGAPYLNLSTNATYVCTPGGWLINSGSGGLPSSGGTMTGAIAFSSSSFANATLQNLFGVSTTQTSAQSLAGPLNAPTINAVINPCLQSGSTADVQINAALALIPNGGTVDGRCYGYSTQNIAATVTVGAGQTLLFARGATTFQPSTGAVNMFAIGAGGAIDGLTSNALNVSYSGNMVSFTGSCGIAVAQQCTLRNFDLINGTNSANPLTGTAVLLKATNGANFLAGAVVEHGRIVGFLNGLYLTATGSISSGYYVNDTKVNDVTVTNSKYCITLYSNPGDVTGNQFVNSSCESGAGNISGQTGIYIEGSTGSNTYGNMFSNFNLWDYGFSGATQNSYTLDANTKLNSLSGNFVYGSHDASSDSGSQNFITDFALPYNKVPIVNMVDSGGGKWSINPSTNGFTFALSGLGAETILGYQSINTNYLTLGDATNPSYIEMEPQSGGGQIWWLKNIGTALQISAGVSPGTTPVSFDGGGGIKAGSSFQNANGTVIPSTATGNTGASTGLVSLVPGPETFGISALTAGVSGTISTIAACTPSATCVYKLTNCGVNASTAVGIYEITNVSVGASFKITALTAGAVTTQTGDASSICWQIN
jgi:hypothetical protein